MEKQPHQEYRDELAEKLKEIRNNPDSENSREDAVDYLNKEKESSRYEEGMQFHSEDRLKFLETLKENGRSLDEESSILLKKIYRFSEKTEEGKKKKEEIKSLLKNGDIFALLGMLNRGGRTEKDEKKKEELRLLFENDDTFTLEPDGIAENELKDTIYALEVLETELENSIKRLGVESVSISTERSDSDYSDSGTNRVLDDIRKRKEEKQQILKRVRKSIKSLEESL